MANTKEIIQIGQTEVRFLLEGSDTNEALAMFEFTVPAGGKVPLPHHHEHYDETVFGLEGTITFTVDGIDHDISVGESCFIKRGQVHGFKNLKLNDGKCLAIVTPAKIGPSFFKDCAAIINAAAADAMDRMKEVFKQYGIVPALPKN